MAGDLTRREALQQLAAVPAAALAPGSRAHRTPDIRIRRVPHGGIQPELVVDEAGTLHLLCFVGPDRSGDLLYMRSNDAGITFSAPVRVNSTPGSAIATGTIRGGQLSVGPDRRAHVAWNGAPRGGAAMPLFYTRSDPHGTAFEPQRDLVRHSGGLDGGGSVAVSPDGTVYAAWHACEAGGPQDEASRRVWIARSDDGGSTFGGETAAWSTPTGACGCCALRACAPTPDAVHVLYRSAHPADERDVWLLTSRDRGASFIGSRVEPWRIDACPMSSMAMAARDARVIAAWETDGQVSCGHVAPDGRVRGIYAPSGGGGGRKHPRIAIGAAGDVLLAWTEGTSWARGGSLACEVFDDAGRAIGRRGSAPGVPAWSFGAVAARRDGGFILFY